MPRPKPVVLVILDGWGIAPASPTNAITQAATPVFDRLISEYPVRSLQAAGEAVGLVWGEMGNSEVGHLNMGSGRIIWQSLPRIFKAISDGTFCQQAVWLAAFEHLKNNPSAKLHLVGLVSNGGVHSDQRHLHALLECSHARGVQPLVHAILDGRDTAKDAGADFIAQLQATLLETGGRIASISGRYWAMDRDNHWERIEPAYRAMAEGVGPVVADPVAAIRDSYARGVFDEEFVPVVVVDGNHPAVTIGEHDVVICFNFRADRMRQLASSFVLPGFVKFERKNRRCPMVVTMTEYDKDLPVAVAFAPDYVQQPVAKVIADAGLRQLHIAETEKYAHVAFFFNGGCEESFSGEQRILVPSPRVASYAEQPAMSAYALTDRLLSELRTQAYDFVVINFANADMVGHTGNLAATIQAIGVVDECVGKITAMVLELGGVAIITADHGNAEELVDLQSGDIDKEHSVNPVPCLLVGEPWAGQAAREGDVVGHDLSTLTPSGVLADIGPTILKILELPIPDEMTGRPLI